MWSDRNGMGIVTWMGTRMGTDPRVGQRWEGTTTGMGWDGNGDRAGNGNRDGDRMGGNTNPPSLIHPTSGSGLVWVELGGSVCWG